jgi:glyoxylase-like metal-dependent hydrolase (beta-lactamase superfamily II)
MIYARLCLCFLLLPGLTAWALAAQPGAAARLTQPDQGSFPDLFMWTDTSNVYILRDGDAALLIDLGDGEVLDLLQDIGVTQVEWVLFIHHHREQAQGYPKLAGRNVRIGAPEAERALFERPSEFRRMEVRLRDPFTIHGSSYVRPPLQPIPVERGFAKMDTFTWRKYEFWCLATPGNSPGAMSYLVKHGDKWFAFSGDVMLSGAKMHTWFDTEWDYGFAAGIYAIHNSAGLLAGFDAAWLLPAHGPVIREPSSQLREFQDKLRRLERLYVRGYDVSTFASGTQDKVSRPSAVPHVWQVSPHLFKFRGPDFGGNFSLILADSGRALVVDCGLINEEFLERALQGLREHYGLKKIDAVIVSHMHGDHFLEAPYLREKWGAEIWALDRMGPVCEYPERFDYAAPVQAYGRPGLERLRFDRLFESGETFTWEGHTFTIDWMPGQTEFALCLHGEIDGRKVAFTGDNLFGDPDDPTHTGHEAVVAHNSGILEEGYIYGAEFLSRLKPDILIGGHSYVMDNPGEFIERFRRWSYEIREAFQSLSPDEDYRYWFDPFLLRAYPYRLSLKTGESSEILLHLRNFRNRNQRHRIEVRTPPGIIAEPSMLEGDLEKESRGSFPVRLRANQELPPGVSIIAFDVTLDGERYGERFDLIIEKQP